MEAGFKYTVKKSSNQLFFFDLMCRGFFLGIQLFNFIETLKPRERNIGKIVDKEIVTRFQFAVSVCGFWFCIETESLQDCFVGKSF